MIENIKLQQWMEKTCSPKGCNACDMCRSTAVEHEMAREKSFGVKNWPCPYNIGIELTAVQEPIPAPITVSNVLDFVKTVINTPKVSEDIVLERLETCKSCRYLKTKDNNMFCNAPKSCGCTLGGRWINSLLKIKAADLTLYEETKDKKLCNHPQRAKGCGWKR